MDPRQSGRFVAENADHVKICAAGVEKCAREIVSRIESGKLPLDLGLYSASPVHPDAPSNSSVEWVFVTSALNFSFWNDEKSPPYRVTYKGKTYNGYMSLCAAIMRSLDEGIPITDPEFYGKVSEEKLNECLMGDGSVPCPLIKERVKCLHEIAGVLSQKYGGTFANCLEESGKSSRKLLEIVTTDFECFRDVACYKGGNVSIWKRAQILVADLWQLFQGKGPCEFEDIDSVTMFADYRVPQSLQYFGALTYSPELLGKLRAGEVLANGDVFEVEIRGCSIEACSRVTRATNEKLAASGRRINDIQVDNFLWGFRREMADAMEAFPFHRTRSIYY